MAMVMVNDFKTLAIITYKISQRFLGVLFVCKCDYFDQFRYIHLNMSTRGLYIKLVLLATSKMSSSNSCRCQKLAYDSTLQTSLEVTTVFVNQGFSPSFYHVHLLEKNIPTFLTTYIILQLLDLSSMTNTTKINLCLQLMIWSGYCITTSQQLALVLK